MFTVTSCRVTIGKSFQSLMAEGEQELKYRLVLVAIDWRF